MMYIYVNYYLFTFVFIFMIQARYLSPEHLAKHLATWKKELDVFEIGHSVCHRPIHIVRLGRGKVNVFMWSQMHGNESTTTRALLKLIPWMQEITQKDLLEELCIHIIPQLNPDGAAAYTRENANGVDLNRDAIALSQPESQCLRNYFDALQPQYCFNLHDQRTLYGAGEKGEAATLSFLAPAADKERSTLPARKKAMQLIATIVDKIGSELPQGIGRFDDTFNPNCVGDTFSALEVPTLLFEAGHFSDDYARNKTTYFVEKALREALRAIALGEYNKQSVSSYFQVPENQKVFNDILLEGVCLEVSGKILKNQYLIIQYLEQLKEQKLYFLPQMISYSANPPGGRFHKTISLSSNLSQIELPFTINKILQNRGFDKLLSIKH
jgi:hypothetical protein